MNPATTCWSKRVIVQLDPYRYRILGLATSTCCWLQQEMQKKKMLGKIEREKIALIYCNKDKNVFVLLLLIR
jgi:hypothetical protein